MPIKNDFPKRIEFVYAHFKEKHFEYGASKPTKEAFITFLGISRGKLQSWERGYWPKEDDVRSIAQKMMFSFSWLMSGTGDPFDVQPPDVFTALEEPVAPFACPQDALQRMTQAAGVPEDAWSISDYFGIPLAEATAYIQQVSACRQAQQAYRQSHPGHDVVPPSLPLPASWLDAARRRYGITPAWLDYGKGKSHEARDDDTPELRTLRGMVDMLKAHGGTNEQIQQIIIDYAKSSPPAQQERSMKQEYPDVKPAFL